MIKKNIILVDAKEDDEWQFLKNVEKGTGDKYTVVYKDTHRMQKGFSKIYRQIMYIFFPLKIVMNRKKIDTIIAWQQFYGLFFAFWMRLFHLKKTNTLIVLTFIYKEKKGFLNKIYSSLIAYILQSGYIDRIVCFSKNECLLYSKLFNVSESIFVSCELNVPDIKQNYITENVYKDDYWIAVGRSNRNYDYLVKELNGTNYNVIIICDNYKLKEHSKNIKLMSNVYGDSYYKYLNNCKGVIIPLYQDDISAGQLVIIQSMMFSKPCIVTETSTTKEYVGKNTGILIKNQKGELKNAIMNVLNNYEVYVSNGRKEYESRFMKDSIAEIVINILSELRKENKNGE